MTGGGTQAEARAEGPRAQGRLGQAGWALFDWAVSPFTTLIITFIFAAYFTQGVVGDPVEGQALWSLGMAVGGIVFALAAPVLGTLADGRGRLKPWIAAFTLVCAAASIALWFVGPDPRFIALALLLVIVGNLASEFAAQFVNALLPGIVSEDRLGRLSGWGWGLGYAGGLAALVLALVALIWPDPSPFGLSRETAEHVRMVGPLVGLWFLLFALPLFLWSPDLPRREGGAETVGQALKALGRRIRELRGEPDLLRFLLAHLLYNNGLLTLFALGGVYASGEFGMTLDEVVLFGIALNVAAGIGAFLFGFVDDALGSRSAILIALVGLIAAASLAVVAPDAGWLWAAGIGIGLFVGPVQASSRALMARMAPDGATAGHFGLFALSGRATAFLGPAAVAAVTAAAGSQRWGIATILLFLVGGLLLLRGVRDGR